MFKESLLNMVFERDIVYNIKSHAQNLALPILICIRYINVSWHRYKNNMYDANDGMIVQCIFMYDILVLYAHDKVMSFAFTVPTVLCTDKEM